MQVAALEGCEQSWMNVVLPADGAGIGQPPGDFIDGGKFGRGDLTISVRELGFREQIECEHRAVPSPEIFRRDLGLRGLAQPVVDVLRFDGMRVARLIEVLEKALSRQALASPHHGSDARVANVELVAHAGLAAEHQPQLAPLLSSMATLERREPERTVVAAILPVSDPCDGGVEKAHHARDHAIAVEGGDAVRGQRRLHRSPDSRQRVAELEQALELGFVAHPRPGRVVAVLLAAAGVAAGGLDVAAFVGADPDCAPCGRNRERPDPRQRGSIRHPAALRVDVAEASTAPAPGEPRFVGDIAQLDVAKRFRGGARSASGSKGAGAHEIGGLTARRACA